jgi:hypothetical protein
MSDLVADKLGADAGTVLAAMLSHGRRFETTVQVSCMLRYESTMPMTLHAQLSCKMITE